MKKKNKKPKKLKLSTLKRKAWDLLSKIVRQHYADHRGMVMCVTCGVMTHWKEAQAGHFIPKKKGTAVYFEWRNVHCQCVRCNIFDQEGAKIMYVRFMERMYGKDEVDRLIALSKTTLILKTGDYLDLIEHYKECLRYV